MRVTVKKWGNSASIRIPVGIMEGARLHLDDQVDVREEGGLIVIDPVRTKEGIEGQIPINPDENVLRPSSIFYLRP